MYHKSYICKLLFCHCVAELKDPPANKIVMVIFDEYASQTRFFIKKMLKSFYNFIL